MPKISKRKVILYLLPVLLVTAYFLARPLLRIATGYAAKQACSCHFLQGRSLDDIAKHDLNFSVLTRVGLSLTDDQGGVRAKIFGLFPREARFITGQGCVLINDPELALPRLAPPPMATNDSIANDLDFNLAASDSLGLDSTKLDEAVDFGMAPVAGGRARALLVFRNGKLAAEAYAPGFDETTLLPGWSMTKSITGILIGLAGIDPAQDRLFPEWAVDERKAITIDDLLKMSSGLEWSEDYGAITDATHMLHREPDFAAYARAKPLVAEPGTEYIYSSGTTNILMQLYLESFSDPQAGIDAMYERLFYPLGANSFRLETDQVGSPVGSSYGWATARDWAKLGQLMLQDGRWGSEQIIASEWIDYLRKSATACPDNDYAGHFWLKSPDTPNFPDDTWLMRGFQDQRVIMLPSQQMLVVRLGHNDDRAADIDGLVERLLSAIN